MQKIIHNIRKQSDRTKRHILNVSMLVSMVLLFTLWVHTLGGTIGSQEVKADIKKNIEPISVLKSNLALPKW